MTSLPTIDIKGKQYVLVKDRIIAFNETCPNGSIITELLPSNVDGLFIFKATVTPDIKNPEHKATGHSQALMGGSGVNATAALENAETSAIGRAIALATSIGVIDSIASADEIHKATYEQKQRYANEHDNGLSDNAVSILNRLPKTLCGSPRVERTAKSTGDKFYPCSHKQDEQTAKCKQSTIWSNMVQGILAQENL